MNVEQLTVEQSLSQAIAQHQARQLQKAEEFYLAILQSDPNHPEANHNLGILAVQMQQPAAGLRYFIAALNADPACAQYWLSAIDALLQTDQLDAAREVLMIAQQQGFQGNEIDALAILLESSVQVAEQQPTADNQHASGASLPVSRAASQYDTKNPSPQEIDALVALFNEKRYPEAVILAQTMTERFPQHGFGWTALGTLFAQLGQHANALIPMQKAVTLSPNDAQTHYNLGNTLKSLGRLDEAEISYRRALEIQPMLSDALYNLGSTLHALGRLDEAAASYRRTLEINSGDADAHYNLGVILHELNRPDEAELSYRRALEIKPYYAQAHNNLGITLQYLGRLNEAKACYLRALEINFNSADAHYNLGSAFQEMGQLNEAEASFRRVLEIKPNYAQASNNLGVVFKNTGRFNEAEASFRQALAIKPDFAEAHYNLAGTLQEMGRLDEAETGFRRALQIMPNYADAYNNLGSFLQNRGQLDDAVAHFRRALEIKTDYVIAHSNLIFTLDLMDGTDAASLLKECKQWNAAHADHLHQQQTHTNIPDSERRIRIGYVSADFRDHSAARAFGGMLTQYDRSQFEVIAYSNCKGKGDRFTELFRQNVTVWRDIRSLPDDAVAKMIHEDRIDILVDLSGHSAGNRLLVFAHKPAPIQITAWGYAAGTGMRAMDVFFADPIIVSPQDNQYFTEEIRYLPSVMGAFFMDPFPDVNKLPALSNGFVTFGSLNRLAKVSDNAYRAWAEVLLAVPGSRLVLKTAELDNVSIQEQVIGYFTQAGVTSDRIIMLGKTPWHEHIQAYHRIDIGLDPFPQGGGITALEGLMMGVPIINLRGSTLAGRLSASIMTNLGLPDWIAESREHYVELAVRKATDLQSLATLRQQLRGIFSSSVLGDQAAYARAVEQEYRKLWQEWCSLA